MKVSDKNFRTVWMKNSSIFLINQKLLPFKFEIFESKNHLETSDCIKNMIVRGAGAIGATAGFAMAQAFIEAPENDLWNYIEKAKKNIECTRPTAQNLFYATNRIYNAAKKYENPKEAAIKEAQKIADEDAESCRKIGEHGDELIKDNFNVQTHCNAGWLAFVDWGSALSPVYLAHRNGKKVFVYVDETRPRAQGARLTAWELSNEHVPHVIVPDNAGACIMSQGKIDIMITGADRIARNGDTANQIGTFEKAIVAKEFSIPFYIAAPSSTFDLNCKKGEEIPIEEIHGKDILYRRGFTKDGRVDDILVCCPRSKGFSPAFDVTPAKYITGIITEKGIVKPNEESITELIS